jgi:hypothetical protein
VPTDELTNTGDATGLEKPTTTSGGELTPEQEQVLSTLLKGPGFEDLVLAGIQELFQRVINLENVLGDVINIVAEYGDQPFTLRVKLRELLYVPEDDDELIEATGDPSAPVYQPDDSRLQGH